MKFWNPSFYDLSNGDSLVDGTAHAFQCHRFMSLFLRVSADVSAHAVRIMHCRNMVRCGRFDKCSHGTKLVPLRERLRTLYSYELGLRP